MLHFSCKNVELGEEMQIKRHCHETPLDEMKKINTNKSLRVLAEWRFEWNKRKIKFGSSIIVI